MQIVSLISAATEMLFAIGLDSQVVGISHECDWPPKCKSLPRVTRSRVNSLASSGAIDAEVKSMLVAGGGLYEVDAELLASLRPDLIVTQTQCDICAVRYEDVVEVVKHSGRFEQTQILPLNPGCLADVFDDMRRIGIAAGVAHDADRAVADLQRRINQVQAQTAKLAIVNRTRVAVIEWIEPLMLAGNWVPELVEIAGGLCELTPRGQHSQYHDWDDIFRYDPQAIVICPCGFDLPRANVEARSLSHRPGWSEMSAVKHGRVFVVDGNAYFNRPGPRLVDSVELMASLLHPSLHESPTTGESLYCRFDDNSRATPAA